MLSFIAKQYQEENVKIRINNIQIETTKSKSI